MYNLLYVFGCKGTTFFFFFQDLGREKCIFLFDFASKVEQPPTILWSLMSKKSLIPNP